MFICSIYILLQKKKFQKCATSKYCLLNESWSLRTSATGPGCVQPLLPQHLGIKAMNHVRQAPESHGTASLEAPVINKSVKKKQNVKLQQPNLKEIYHQQLCFAADEIGNKTLTPSSNELSLFVKSTNIKLFPWCLWRTSHRTWPLGCWDNESTGNLLDINWTLATWVCLKIVYPFLPNG